MLLPVKLVRNCQCRY